MNQRFEIQLENKCHAHDAMMHKFKLARSKHSKGGFHTWDVTKRPPLKESRPEIPTEKGKGRDTSCEDPLRSPMLLLYRNDETTEP